MFYSFVDTNNVKRMLIYLMTMVHQRETSRRSFQKYLFCFFNNEMQVPSRTTNITQSSMY